MAQLPGLRHCHPQIPCLKGLSLASRDSHRPRLSQHPAYSCISWQVIRSLHPLGSKLTFQRPGIASKVHSVNLPCSTYRSDTKSLPAYRSFTTVKRSFLSENNEILRRLPYIDDQDPADIALALQEYYVDEIDGLLDRHLQTEKAARLLPLADKILQEFGCSREMVLSYLRSSRQKTGDTPLAASVTRHSQPKRAQTKDLQEPTAGSSAATSRDTVIMQLCEGTLSVTGISLETILQSKQEPASSPGVNLGGLQGGSGITCESESSLLMCMICYR